LERLENMQKLIRHIASLAVVGALFSARQSSAEAPSAAAATRAEIKSRFGFVPGFIVATPDAALPGAWREMSGLQMNDQTALPGKIKELIGLAVAAQIPCRYCVYAHTELAKLNGASDTELGEALSMAAIARHWSTIFQGAELDEVKFRQEIGAVVARARQPAPAKPPPAIAIVDAASVQADMRQSFGFVPSFVAAVPNEVLPGAWVELKSVELNPETQLSGKYKSLIGLAVAAQIPCRYCIIADTEFAKLDGATERELHEAVAMSALVRHWSTLINGLQVDEAGYRRDVDRLVASAKHHAAEAHPATKKTAR